MGLEKSLKELKIIYMTFVHHKVSLFITVSSGKENTNGFVFRKRLTSKFMRPTDTMKAKITNITPVRCGNGTYATSVLGTVLFWAKFSTKMSE